MIDLKLTISEERVKELQEEFEERRGPSEWQILARAILELADKATWVNEYSIVGDSVVMTRVTLLDPETERALRRIAEDDET